MQDSEVKRGEMASAERVGRGEPLRCEVAKGGTAGHLPWRPTTVLTERPEVDN